MDVSVVRKRVLLAIEAARRDAAARRVRIDAAGRAYEAFLQQAAAPAFQAVAMALRAENIPFEVATPAGAVQLVSTRSRDAVIELQLDDTVDPPHPVVSVTRSRGRGMVRTERALAPGKPIEEICDEDVVAMLLEELKPWLA
jgi:hypothetical protein